MSSTVKSQVSLPADVDKHLRFLGHGRLSAGIAFLATQSMRLSVPAAQTGRPATATQRKASMHQDTLRDQCVMSLRAYAERENLTADSPDLLEAIEQHRMGITVDEVLGSAPARTVPTHVDQHQREQMIAAYREAAKTRTIHPLELEALEMDITMDDIVPVAAILSDWVE